MNKQRGFTLIELMIVVAILGILLAIAVPQYSSYVTKSRRVDAQQVIVSYGQSLERYYTANGTYVSGSGCGVAAPAASKYYTFSGNCGANSYTATATAKTGTSQTSDGDQSITNTGLKTGKWSQ